LGHWITCSNINLNAHTKKIHEDRSSASKVIRSNHTLTTAYLLKNKRRVRKNERKKGKGKENKSMSVTFADYAV
jgi:hypothetical protein